MAEALEAWPTHMSAIALHVLTAPVHVMLGNVWLGNSNSRARPSTASRQTPMGRNRDGHTSRRGPNNAKLQRPLRGTAPGHNDLGQRLAFLLTHVPSRHHRVRAPPATAGVGGVAWPSLQGGNVSRITFAER